MSDDETRDELFSRVWKRIVLKRTQPKMLDCKPIFNVCFTDRPVVCAWPPNKTYTVLSTGQQLMVGCQVFQRAAESQTLSRTDLGLVTTMQKPFNSSFSLDSPLSFVLFGEKRWFSVQRLFWCFVKVRVVICCIKKSHSAIFETFTSLCAVLTWQVQLSRKLLFSGITWRLKPTKAVVFFILSQQKGLT